MAPTILQARTIFRMVEFSQSFTGTISQYEAYFYCLEALPILCAVVLFNIWHPGRLIDGSHLKYQEKAEVQLADRPIEERG